MGSSLWWKQMLMKTFMVHFNYRKVKQVLQQNHFFFSCSYGKVIHHIKIPQEAGPCFEFQGLPLPRLWARLITVLTANKCSIVPTYPSSRVWQSRLEHNWPGYKLLHPSLLWLWDERLCSQRCSCGLSKGTGSESTTALDQIISTTQWRQIALMWYNTNLGGLLCCFFSSFDSMANGISTRLWFWKRKVWSATIVDSTHPSMFWFLRSPALTRSCKAHSCRVNLNIDTPCSSKFGSLTHCHHEILAACILDKIKFCPTTNTAPRNKTCKSPTMML